MKLIIRIISTVIIGFSTWIIYKSPVLIVGEYPMFMAFISLLAILISLITFLKTFEVNKKMSKGLTNIFITIVIIGGLGLIPGIIFTEIHFKKAKSYYLIENGIVNKSLITSKKSSKMNRRGRELKGFQIHYKFLTNEKEFINSFDIVSEDEFNLVNKGDSVLVIYSIEKPEIVDLIIDDKTIEIYKTKIHEIKK